MAKSNRDLTIALVAKADKFDLSEPAQDLEKLGEAGKDAGRDVKQGLDDIGGAAKDAGRDMERGLRDGEKAADSLGDKADQTRRDLDAFFDKLGAGAKKAGRDTKDGLRDGERAMDSFKDEAHQSGREAAASFSGGFDDIGDFVQETAANAFGGFGALGAGAGIAAAAGIGFITKAITDAREQFEELRQEFTAGLIEGGGDLKGEAILDKIRQMAEDGTINDFADQARKARVPVEDYLLALAGDPGALDRTRSALEKFGDNIGGINLNFRAGADEAAAMRKELDRVDGAYGEATSATERYLSVSKDLTDEQDALRAAQEAAAEKNQAFADSMTGVADEAANMAEAIEGGIDKVIEAQAKQLSAQVDYEKNTKAVFDKLGQAAVDWALSQGENADEAMQLLADAPKEKGKKVVDQWTKLGGRSTQGYADGVIGQKASTNAAIDDVIAGMRARAAQGVTVPVHVGMPSELELSRARRMLQNAVSAVPVSFAWGQGRFLP